MNMVKSVLLGGLALATSVFAEDDRKNICDELGTDVVNLKLAYVDETKWLGDFALTSAESHSTVRHETLDQMKAIAKEFPYKIPYSVDAGCLVQKQVTYSYLQWNESKKQWAENSENHDFATTILDIHGNRTETYDSTNAYNLLIVRAHNETWMKNLMVRMNCSFPRLTSLLLKVGSLRQRQKRLNQLLLMVLLILPNIFISDIPCLRIP
ncbi:MULTISPECIES: hypothetical protein [unclassified Fibrobacter]|uniref:hypothetical protein n=1 Tax=unclassified Fibrobacter TaxID=2634177 RepID=UPI000D6CBECB|nr:MULTISPECIES: hypothetical protein [unclassified Fibrobacter]PWJ69940.1 hypothetical protein BGX12_10418 [Fibrobacter sp. UWR4]PZW73111.1 hypothetical protein C8E88_100418 [Fibrobacter sp. UWR1]